MTEKELTETRDYISSLIPDLGIDLAKSSLANMCASRLLTYSEYTKIYVELFGKNFQEK